ncbi:hypothetical protein CROQUDRAFT_47254 [Cronartium quercuum f. sp. fusiforme G11]|uniref:Uncharacterized protein n=1 Tax=Cronartium quercuum f. sp. fusiforme G11 TaxID=708437 RepID=A0A9P6TAC7_9BASI|nr:hypothetical protein CROQUDRAFT_47254 [Cronartium quercuum f. sp. fusiforme G11]
MTVYHLQITLLDRSSPNSSRRILRGSSSIRSAGRTPYPSATGLPGKLDFQIASSPTYIPISQAGFWEDFSKVHTTRLGERWDQLPEPKPISPAAFWYEPDSIIPPTEQSTPQNFTPAPTLDYRFGPIAVDWIDYPAYHPAFDNTLEHSTGLEASSNNEKGIGFEMRNSTFDLPTTSRKVEKSLNRSQINLPTGRFVPHDDDQKKRKGKYQLGSTDFGYGTIHLYRDFDDASDTSKSSESQSTWLEGDSDPSWIKKQQRVRSHKQQGSSSNQPDDTKSEEDTEGTVIGVLAIPSYMTAQDFLAFISPFVESIQSVRMLRDALPNRCMGLIKFRSRSFADRFAHEFNGRPFSHLQDREICHTARIRSIKFKSSLIPPFTFPALLPPDLITTTSHELPTCPVCLERMDPSVTGLMTSTCSHTFHCACLSNWGDSRCPICRYSQTKLSDSKQTESSECAACGSDANLWICLICGHLGCGRYQGGHAYKHFEESSHLYALELGSQRVWDYVSDNYVHRLIQTKSDQIVELPALSSAVFDSRSGGGPGPNESAQQSKIEAISEEFGHLVASQLDSQRAFYEQEIEMLRARLGATKSESIIPKANSDVVAEEALRKRVEELEERLRSVQEERDEIYAEAQKDRVRLERKAEKAMELGKKFEKELKEEQAMGVGMRAKLTKLENERETSERRTKNLEEEVAELRDQLRDLMFFLDAQTKIEKEGGQELRGGTLVVPPPTTHNIDPALPPSNSGKPSRRKKK